MQKKIKILLASVLGNALEFYDFTLFGAFTLKFTEIFWSQAGSDIDGIRNAFFMFGIAFFFRPLGALFFGTMGDRLGRRKALALSITFMGIATFAIGCLPTGANYGLLAAILLIGFRCLQGFCLGGENNGSAIFLLEHLKHRKGLAGALILTGGALGTVLAYGTSAIVAMETMPKHAWRWPFLFSLVIAMLGLYIRQRLPEPDTFVQGKRLSKDVLLTLWNEHRAAFACAIGIGGVNVALAYTNTVYLHTFVNKVAGWGHVPSIQMGAIAASLFGFLFAPIMGHLADRFHPRRVMYGGCLMISLMAFPLFHLLGQGTRLSVGAGIVISALMTATFNGPSNMYLNTLFPQTLRYTGVAFGYAIGAAIFGGMASNYYEMIKAYFGTNTAPGYYLVAMGILGALSLWYTPKKTH